MAYKPFSYNLRDDSITYSPGRYAPEPGQLPGWSTGDQPIPKPYNKQLLGMLKLGLGIGALRLIGNRQFGDRRGWDYIIQGIRAAEEYSPGHILRTFQLGNIFSPLAREAQEYRYISQAGIHQLSQESGVAGAAWLDHISRLTGKNIRDPKIAVQGFRFENGQLLVGRTGGEVLLDRAGVMFSPAGGGMRFPEAYARSLAGKPVHGLSKASALPIEYMTASGTMAREAFMIEGGSSRLQHAGRYASGLGTMLVERLNQLSRAPFELPVISSLLKKAPVIKNLRFGVIPSGGLGTLAKMTGKLGLVGYGAYLGYKELDYRIRENKLLDNTILGEGITAGAATAWTRIMKGVSRGAEILGMHAYREKQEEIAPGSTSLMKLAAFPVMGAGAGLVTSYLDRLGRMYGLQKSGLDLGQANKAVMAEDAFFKELVYGRAVPQELMKTLDPSTLGYASYYAGKQAESRTGKLITHFAKLQKGKGRLAKALQVFGDVTPGRMRWMLGIAAGAALVAPFVPGALMPSKRPEELEALYTGQKRVPIRRGRWWEFGRSSYEGENIDRFRQHWYARLLARSKEKAIWGEDAPSPLQRFWKENFTYEPEMMHYYDRPYPITGTAFEDVPLLGPILAATVGRIAKPPALMHTEDWVGGEGPGGESLFKAPYPKMDEVPAPGELNRGAPISPYSAKGVFGEQMYRFTEMVGLPGFTFGSIKEALTGEEEFFGQEAQLESARRMYGAEREYWEQEWGGALGTSELMRRLYPHRRHQIELYNPIRNTMPTWLPGPGERAPDFLHGDPFTKVKEGESRLPGAGYAALHPELAGVAPEDYPLIHRYAILSDIAPYAERTKVSAQMMQAAIARGEATQEEAALYQLRLDEAREKKQRKRFSPYQYEDRMSTWAEQMLADANEASKQEKPGFFTRVIGKYWEKMAHGAETPLDYLTPAAPGAKMVHMRTALEDYERTQLYGSDSAFWSHPIRDFIRPFLSSTTRSMGLREIPSEIRWQRDLEAYFDVLEYIKYTRLKHQALFEKDSSLASAYEEKRRETLFGLNPYTYKFSHMMRALPRRERDYFDAFTNADLKERQRILEMVPSNERALYQARWELKDAGDVQAVLKKGLVGQEKAERLHSLLAAHYNKRETEGMPKTQQLWAEYQSDRTPGESYPDWYRRTKLMAEAMAGRDLPGPDWVGWHPAVDLEDIKLKIVTNEGKNMYDFDLWPDRLRNVARRPIIDIAAQDIQQGMSERGQDPESLRRRVTDIMSAHGLRPGSVMTTPTLTGNSVEVDIRQDRSRDKRTIRRIMANG